MALAHNELMNVEAYLEFDRNSEARYEYVDGKISLLAGGSRNHATVAFTLARLLWNTLGGGPCHVYTSDMRVSVSPTRYFYPDVTVSCDERDAPGEDDILHSPRLVIEVLSPNTESYDRGDKFGYYQRCPTIQEYVLVSTRQQRIEVYRRTTGKRWTLDIYEPDDEVELASLAVRFPLKAVYKGTSVSALKVQTPQEPDEHQRTPGHETKQGDDR